MMLSYKGCAFGKSHLCKKIITADFENGFKRKLSTLIGRPSGYKVVQCTCKYALNFVSQVYSISNVKKDFNLYNTHDTQVFPTLHTIIIVSVFLPLN